jgi:tetratricopeptide (TPR) repeat protein
MPRRWTACLIALAATSAFTTGRAADPAPDDAFALVVRPPWSQQAPPKPEELAAARRVIDAQAASDPKSARWVFAQGQAARRAAHEGKAGEAKRKEALERFEKAASLEPGNADYQFWLGSAAFDRADDVSLFSKMSLASTGRKAFEKAIAIDSNHVAARVGMAQFFLQAPAIAGGSIDKARDAGNALVALPDRRGEFQGRMVLAQIAEHDEKWDEMSRQLVAAETASGDGADPVGALRMHAWMLLNRKKDAQAALPVLDRYAKIAKPDDLTAIFLQAEANRQLGRCADALPKYDQVLAKFDGARGSRWGAAVCREQLGQKEAARRDYEEFARRFPDDDHTKDAKAAVKRLSGS